MSRALSTAAAGLVLAGPTVIAFASGGFFDTARLVAGIVACALLLAAAVVAERPLPRSLPGRLALAGLAGLAVWSALSLTWAPLGAPAIDDVQRLLLYAASLGAAAAWLRGPFAERAGEPLLALGLVVVVGYGLSERLLPGVLDFASSSSANGRLEQPITYWNGMGALAAFGLVLCARLAGSPGRPVVVSALAASAAPLLAAGLYLSFSRGALAAVAVGALALMLLAPDRSQARGVGLAALTGGLAIALAAVLPEVEQVDGGGSAAEQQGAVLLGGLVVLGVVAVVATVRLARSEQRQGPAARRLGPARIRAIAAVLLAAVAVAAVVAAGSGDAAQDPGGADISRFRSLESSRYDYWQVALGSFADNPLAGVGTGGFRVEWDRERDLPESVRDAHSLYLETAAELGLAGLILLGTFIAGVALAARGAYRLDPAAATGPVAVLAAWALHAGFDWDWEMPAVTLYALALAGLLLALSEPGTSPRRALQRT